MESRAKLFGHALHPILIVFPLGLLSTAVIFDVIYLITRNPTWALVSFWVIAAGIIGGLLAALPGFIDYLAIPDGTRAKAVAALHGVGNVVVLAFFVISWLLRRHSPTDPSSLVVALEVAGAGLAMMTGWLGGELVERLGVGVYDGAHLDSPNSLSNRPADESSAGTNVI
jgi:uncharacterized membrane protein